ncbi:MAG TPA: MBL fold metallo-hydrolase [Verrucomicrobiae bacterium]|nr:MBL fold metallo-hydrolase [Verrucomicrobiae bacterium]
MRITFLGTGTSHGIPMLGCDCAVCRSNDPRNNRLRPSVFVETGVLNLLIDATPDFRTQALRAGIRHIDAVLLTHTHADHYFGLDDLRAFIERQGHKMPLYGSAKSLADVQRVFPYACTETPAWPGLPSFSVHPIVPHERFEIADVKIRALPVPHGQMTVFGFMLNDAFAYVTDCNAVPADVVECIKGVPVLALDALRSRPHPTHLTIEQAVAAAGRIGAKRTFLTHLCHEADHEATQKSLPPGVQVAYDGLMVEVNNAEVVCLA